MARQRGNAGGGAAGFWARIFGRGPGRSTPAPLPCESWFFRWEWLDAQGNRIASGTHSIIRPRGERPQAVAQRARGQLLRNPPGSLTELMALHPGGRLFVTRVEEPLPVSGPC